MVTSIVGARRLTACGSTGRIAKSTSATVITHAATEGINAGDAAINIESTGGWYVVRGFTIRGDGSMERAGIRVAASDHVQLLDNTVDGAVSGLFVSFAENLIEALNIVASIFYPALLGVFLVAFFLKKIGGSAVFWAALSSQALVIALFFLGKKYPAHEIGYLWLNPIGCIVCVVFSVTFQALIGKRTSSAESAPTA